MASSNAPHGWNEARGVGRLFKWLAAGRSLERKPMVAWASQGGGGFRREQMGLQNEYRAWMPWNRGLSDYWNLQGCEMGSQTLSNFAKHFGHAKWVCIGFSNFAWDFTRQSWFTKFLEGKFGVAKFFAKPAKWIFEFSQGCKILARCIWGLRIVLCFSCVCSVRKILRLSPI